MERFTSQMFTTSMLALGQQGKIRILFARAEPLKCGEPTLSNTTATITATKTAP